MKARLALAFAIASLVAAALPTVAGAAMHDGHDKVGITNVLGRF